MKAGSALGLLLNKIERLILSLFAAPEFCRAKN
jgi:hypothetical protein